MSEWTLNIKVIRNEDDVLNSGEVVITNLQDGTSYTLNKYEVTIYDLIPIIKKIMETQL